ncbi:flotillin family protein [Salsuginibacillus kocurii]|uniref:flotillin family protein n=1 Tax=Salsuginibacillus kocurii TaxID=427078 RepID=UPI000371B132|nr:SPFH domain-containing protein [Salsuginibacillus kocurii]
MELGLLFIFLFIVLVLAALGGVGYYIFMKFRYRTARSNEALIITGPKLGDDTNVFSDQEGRSMKIIRGGGYRLRRFQTSTPVDLTSFQLPLTTPRIYTHGGVPIMADAVAMVKVSDGLEGIANYAEQFLGKDQDTIEKEITEVLESNLRAILSKMTVEGINADREDFNAQVTQVAQRQLDEMGFRITSLGLTDLRDADEENGYLENLGRPQIAKVRKEAEISEAESQRETRINKAKNDQEAKEEEYEREIAVSESRKNKDIREAENKRETEQARAASEQAYDLEKARLAKDVAEQELALERQKREEDLRLQHLEREQAVRLEEEESKVRKTKADAEHYETTKQAEANAEKARIDGEAEAHVIAERGKAEAHARELLAEAMERHGEIIIKEKLIEILPEFAEKIAQPLNNIESVKIIDSGNGQGVSSFGKSVTNTMLDLQEPLKEIAGVDLGDMLQSLANGKENVEDAAQKVYDKYTHHAAQDSQQDQAPNEAAQTEDGEAQEISDHTTEDDK